MRSAMVGDGSRRGWRLKTRLAMVDREVDDEVDYEVDNGQR